jgi:hypothetical protein
MRKSYIANITFTLLLSALATASLASEEIKLSESIKLSDTSSKLHEYISFELIKESGVMIRTSAGLIACKQNGLSRAIWYKGNEFQNKVAKIMDKQEAPNFGDENQKRAFLQKNLVSIYNGVRMYSSGISIGFMAYELDLNGELCTSFVSSANRILEQAE